MLTWVEQGSVLSGSEQDGVPREYAAGVATFMGLQFRVLLPLAIPCLMISGAYLLQSYMGLQTQRTLLKSF